MSSKELWVALAPAVESFGPALATGLDECAASLGEARPGLECLEGCLAVDSNGPLNSNSDGLPLCLQKLIFCAAEVYTDLASAGGLPSLEQLAPVECPLAMLRKRAAEETHDISALAARAVPTVAVEHTRSFLSPLQGPDAPHW
jgi:hypothetical protein